MNNNWVRNEHTISLHVKNKQCFTKKWNQGVFLFAAFCGPDKSAGLLAQIYCDAIYFIQNLAHVIFTLRKCVVFFKYYAVWGHKELDML